MPYESNVANLALYTPLDSKALIDGKISMLLTEEEFLNECYVPPHFLLQKHDNLTDINEEAYDYVVLSEQIQDWEREQISSYQNFQHWLESDSNTKIYTISGHAGTGKTTFVHKLKQSLSQYNWIILDLSRARDSVLWFYDIQTNVKNFRLAYSKMYAIVLDKICSLLFPTPDPEILVNHLRDVIHLFNKHKKYHARGDGLFTDLDVALQNSSETHFKLSCECANITRNYFSTLENKNQGDYKSKFRDALDVLLRLYSCIEPVKNHIVVFDNIERFVSHDEIYNKDLDDIRRDMKSYSDGISLRANIYMTQFKFIIVMRSCSVRLCGAKQQSADELPSDVNLTDWFNMNDIIERKQKWYANHGVNDPNMTLLLQILCDLRICKDHELTGLQLFINPLFNGNKRLMIEFIGNVIEKNCYQEYLRQYQRLWQENTSISRFGARSIVRGTIYQELDSRDNLFQNLLLYSQDYQKTGNITYGLGYVRKILTILYNYQLRDLTLETIIAEICHINSDVQQYWNDLSDVTKESISEVLYYMNSYNRRINDWIQFIDLQIVNRSSNVVVRDKKTLKKLMDQGLQDLCIQIMPAGKTYIRYIVPSFEYFAYRFNKYQAKNYQPLFCLIPTKEELDQTSDISKLPCIQIINYVKDNAIKCARNIMNNGDIHLFLHDQEPAKKHIQRIKALHQGYIDKFVEYVRQKYENEECPNLQKLIQECIALKNEYNNMEEE